MSLKPRPIVSSGIRMRPQRPMNPNPDPVSDPASLGLVRKEVPEESQPRPRLGRIEAAQPEVYNFRFSAQKPFRDKLERLAEVLGVHDPNRNLGTLLEKAIDLALEKNDPQKKLERREKRAKSAQKSCPDKIRGDRSRYVPSAVVERVLARANHQCEYQGPDGTRCEQRTGLQIDHRQPFSRGGGHAEANLRALCGAHNRWCAERAFGRGFVEKKIQERQGKSRSSPRSRVR